MNLLFTGDNFFTIPVGLPGSYTSLLRVPHERVVDLRHARGPVAAPPSRRRPRRAAVRHCSLSPDYRRLRTLSCTRPSTYSHCVFGDTIYEKGRPISSSSRALKSCSSRGMLSAYAAATLRRSNSDIRVLRSLSFKSPMSPKRSCSSTSPSP